MEYIDKIRKELLLNGIKVKMYDSNESLNIRDKLNKKSYQSSLNDFVDYLKNEMNIVL